MDPDEKDVLPGVDTNGEPSIDRVEQKIPICPGCGADPLTVIPQELNIAQYKFMVIMCAECRVPLPAVLIAVAQPMIQQPKPRPLIIKPS